MKQYLILFLLFTFTSSFVHNRQEKGILVLSCTLTSDKKNYKVGELPKFNAIIKNISKQDIYLIGALDGSDGMLRYPYCYFVVSKPKENKRFFGRCGNTNPLRIEDFVLVKAGQSFSPYGERFFSDIQVTNNYTFQDKGIYKIKFYYTTKSTSIKDYQGDEDQRQTKEYRQKLEKLFKLVPRTDLSSNEIEIKVE
jgi:hypothetical protein